MVAFLTENNLSDNKVRIYNIPIIFLVPEMRARCAPRINNLSNLMQ